MNKELKVHTLSLRWTVSRARDTEGYNIVTLTNGKGAKFQTLGGGYDMCGKVFGHWLMAEYGDKIKEQVIPYGYDNENAKDGIYGFFTKDGRYWLDGACGIDCMISIAKAIGLQVSYITRPARKRNEIIGYTVIEREIQK